MASASLLDPTYYNADGTPKAGVTPPLMTAAAAPAPVVPPPSMMQAAATNIAATNANPATTITPALIGADPEGGVAGRVGAITSSGSPLMEQAKTQGTQLAAQRGLTNSSLAGQAEQQAVLSAATPIAQADTSFWNQAQQSNQQAINSAAATSAQLTESARQSDQSLAMTQQQLDTQKAQFAAQLGMTQQDLDLRRDTLTQSQQQFLADLDMKQKQLDQQVVLQKMTGDQQIALADIEAQYKTQIQGDINISQAWGTTMQGISQIQNNPQLDAATKTTLINNQLQSFASFASFWQKASSINPTTGGSPSIDDLLNFTIGTGAAPAPAPAPAPGVPAGTPAPPPGYPPGWVNPYPNGAGEGG